MTKPLLHIGNKVYSSWSMRPWLALTWAGIAFDEKVIPLGGPGYGKSRIPEVLAVSPSGRVPALRVGEATIWDSLAICQWAHEQAPDAGLWPADPAARGAAWSAAAEMHSSYAALRADFPMNLRRIGRPRAAPASDGALADIDRVDELWSFLRAQFGVGGPYLCGSRGVVDAMFAPVATRFRSYGVALSPSAQAYVDAVLSDPAVRAWDAAAQQEPWTIPSTDDV